MLLKSLPWETAESEWLLQYHIRNLSAKPINSGLQLSLRGSAPHPS